MTLREHMRELHPNVKLPRSNADLIKLHKTLHWRYWLSHTHGATSGPSDRPVGWTTGGDVELRKERRGHR